jgi:glycosyltransferase involved in cell wall biosynthesis/capsular polysaccharide biosynthesis protein
MTDDGMRPSVLHVIMRAGATNSQYNEHCLPVYQERRITIASLFPSEVKAPPGLRMVEGDGSLRGCLRTIRFALELGPYDAVHVHAPASGILTLLVYLRTLRSRRDLVFTVHNSWKSFRRRNRAFLYLIMFLYPTIVMCGAAAAGALPRVLRWMVAPRLSIIPNGVDVDRIDAAVGRRTEYSHDGGFTVLSVNRLIPIKDPWIVLQSFERLHEPRAELVLVGDGELREGLEAGSKLSTARNQIRITGLIPRDEVYRLLRVADVFISASKGEGLPVAVLEAMACGCPVVLSDIPPHREIAAVTPGVLLVDVGDIAGFAAALRQLQSYDTAERRALGEQQRNSVTERFSVRAMNDAYRELYMQLMESNGGPRRSPAEQNGHRSDNDDGDVVGLLARMRARLGTCIVLTLLGAFAGLGYAQLQDPQYQAATSLIVGDVVGGPADQDALDASAALAGTYADLARREPVLAPVAADGFADSWQDLQPQVHAQVGDRNPQLVEITAVAPTADTAERLAESVADAVVALAREENNNRRNQFVAGQLTELQDQITQTQSAIDEINAEISAGASEASFRTDLRRLNRTLEDQQSDYATMLETTANSPVGANVSVLEHAYTTRHPIRPDTKTMVAAGAGVGLALAATVCYIAGRRRTARVDTSFSGARPPYGGGPEPNGDDTQATRALFDQITSDRGGSK